MPPKTKQSRRPQTQTLCKICNIWIADNKPQRDQHESGAKHIANRQRLLREIAERNEKERAQARREGRRIAGDKGNLVVQQMMEIAMQATEVKIKKSEAEEEDDKEEEVILGQEVDENGYPLPANAVFQWTTVGEEEANESQSEEPNAEGLGQVDTQEEQSNTELFDKGEASGVKRLLESEETVAAADEGAEERSAALATFKKRKSVSGRKKRRRH